MTRLVLRQTTPGIWTLFFDGCVVAQATCPFVLLLLPLGRG